MQRTLFVHHRSGIGDLVWHLPYIRAVAATSAGGKVTVMARPSCMAEDILAGEPCVERVIEYDRRPRNKSRKGKHDSILGQLRMCMQLRRERFDRIVIFSGRPRYGVLAWLAGIPVRSGFGFDMAQRLFLNKPPYIHRFEGEGSWVYPEATDFAMAQGFVEQPVVPKMQVPASLVAAASAQLAHLTGPRFAFAIGSSLPEKSWGNENFVALAKALVDRGCSVLILGGPGEKEIAERLFSFDRERIHIMCQPSVLISAAALKNCDFCVGNDTGIINVAVAVDVPALGLFGTTLPLKHDPLMHGVSGKSMADISVGSVMDRLAEIHVRSMENSARVLTQ